MGRRNMKNSPCTDLGWSAGYQWESLCCVKPRSNKTLSSWVGGGAYLIPALQRRQASLVYRGSFRPVKTKQNNSSSPKSLWWAE